MRGPDNLFRRNSVNTIARRTAAAAGAAVLGLSIAAPAQAARYVHTDPAGDVVECPLDSDCSAPTTATTQAPDVRTFRVKHAARRVVIFASFTDLARSSDLTGYLAQIRTNEGVRRDAAVFTEGRSVGKDFSRPNGDTVRCSGFERTVDYTANTVVMRIPRSCLSRPRWVQVGYGAFTVGGGVGRFDEALVAGAGTSDDLVYSPRIRRG